MTQVGEAVLVGMFKDETLKAEKCEQPEKPPQWKARINKGIGSNSDCDAQRLFDSMKRLKDDRGYRGGLEPFIDKTPDMNWTLADCRDSQFPLQAHHIIPKNYLPTHKVCAFLAKNYTSNPDAKLTADTPYDTDHAYNGYCLPYATPFKEWQNATTPARKDDVAVQVMKLTKRQLHQGSHKEYQYSQESNAAHEEEDDEVGHSDVPGYLLKIKGLLDVVSASAVAHNKICKVCKPAAEAREINPRLSVVRHVDQASGITKALMDSHRIFVSERAFRAYISQKTDPTVPDWLKAPKTS